MVIKGLSTQKYRSSSVFLNPTLLHFQKYFVQFQYYSSKLIDYWIPICATEICLWNKNVLMRLENLYILSDK